MNIFRPPIGLQSHWTAVNERNAELSKAITRYSNDCLKEGSHKAVYIRNIKKWALEIVGNCDTELKLLQEEGRT